MLRSDKLPAGIARKMEERGPTKEKLARLVRPDLTLSHYSPTIVKKVYPSIDPGDPDKSIIGKPSGFWLSVDGPDDWPNWCFCNDFNYEHLRQGYKHRVILRPDVKILYILDAQEFWAFSENFRKNSLFGRQRYELGINLIDWGLVAESYEGIMIPYYFGELRFEDYAAWYTTWDCACGCIWDAEAIEDIHLVPNDLPSE